MLDINKYRKREYVTMKNKNVRNDNLQGKVYAMMNNKKKEYVTISKKTVLNDNLPNKTYIKRNVRKQ